MIAGRPSAEGFDELLEPFTAPVVVILYASVAGEGAFDRIGTACGRLLQPRSARDLVSVFQMSMQAIVGVESVTAATTLIDGI